MHRPQSPQPHLHPATPTAEPEGGANAAFRDLPEAITYGTNDQKTGVIAAKVVLWCRLRYYFLPPPASRLERQLAPDGRRHCWKCVEGASEWPNKEA